MNTIKPPITAVLFDLDGTLLDTAPDFAFVVNQLRQRYGKPPLNYSLIRATVSNGARALITLAFELEEGDSGFDNLRQQLLDLYSQHLDVNTKPFDGISELLNWLDRQPLLWGIVTNKPRLYTDPILKALGLNSRCATVVCPDDVQNTKPDPEPLHLACRHMERNVDQTLYIGDHRRDIEAGINAKMRTIAANYGYISDTDPTENWGADFHVDHACELIPLIQSLTPQFKSQSS
ncbi:MAG: 2-phosphoglycolate phosphatase [Oceanicoccus sp.]|jgi:2-phosphoglycolate phosphatase